jgi:hypothetical protein
MLDPHIQGGVVPKPPASPTRLDPGRSDVGMLIGAMLRAREVIATKSWSTSQEPTSEHWWADVLADPRARIWRQPRGFYGRAGRRTAQKSRLADEPSPLIEVACRKCEWKAAFSHPELIANYGAEYPLPNLLAQSRYAGLLEDQKPTGSVRRLLCQPMNGGSR